MFRRMGMRGSAHSPIESGKDRRGLGMTMICYHAPEKQQQIVRLHALSCVTSTSCGMIVVKVVLCIFQVLRLALLLFS
jgi:hypothetical protein